MKTFIKVPFHNLPALQTVGRAGGSFERTDPQDRNEWNSDDEDVDEFGRRKKRKTSSKKSSQDIGAEESFAKASSSTFHQPGPNGADANAAFGMYPWLAQGCMQSQSSGAPGFPNPQMPPGLQQMAVALQQMAASGNLQVPRPKAAVWRPPQAAETMWRGRNTAWPGIECMSPEPVEVSTRPKVPMRPWNGVPIVPCKFYQEGNCSRGETCTFLHSGPGGVVDCKYWVLGKCIKGAGCPFRHVKGMSASASSFVDFETGLPKSADEDTSSSNNTDKKASQSGSSKSADGSLEGNAETGVNMDKALEELLNMV